MYKKDKQGLIVVLIGLTVLLAAAIALKWQGTIVAAGIGLTVVIVHVLSEIHQRLSQLEQTAPSDFVQTAGIGLQKIVIYSAALIALFAYANTWMWLAGGALLVLLLCLVQTISTFQTRLLHLEQYATQSARLDISTQTQQQAPSTDESVELVETTASNTSHFEQQSAWMQAQPESVQSPILQNSSSAAHPSEPKHPAWWQPALDWMIHGNPILRVAVAVLTFCQ